MERALAVRTVPAPPRLKGFRHCMNLTPAMTDSPFLYDRSGAQYLLTDRRWRGDDGSPLELSALPGISREQIDTAERSLWRYQAAIPVDRHHRVSLGEGCTPMLPLTWDGRRVHFKLEWFNPTSSFKDRGVSVMMSHLRGQGATRVLEDSSGNGGSSVAAYAAAAGIKAKIIVPAATSAAKMLQARAYGAQIELVERHARPGLRRGDPTVRADPLRQPQLAPVLPAGHEDHRLRDVGVAAVHRPDNVVLVAGAGSNILGCDIAFSELLAAGQIDRRPAAPGRSARALGHHRRHVQRHRSEEPRAACPDDR